MDGIPGRDSWQNFRMDSWKSDYVTLDSLTAEAAYIAASELQARPSLRLPPAFKKAKLGALPRSGAMRVIQIVVARKDIKVRGKSFASIKGAAEYFGASVSNVGRRLRTGWTVEEALGLAPHRIRRPLQMVRIETSQGVFPSIQEAAKHFGVEAGTIQYRLSEGWTADQAVGIAYRKRKPKITVAVVCAGKSYPNRWELARAFDKKPQLVAKRLDSGWTPEQAVGLEESPPRFRNQIGGATNKHWKKIEIVDSKEYPATDLGHYKVYVIRNKLDGKGYVGITINPLWMRFNGHKRAALVGQKSKLYNAMRAYGPDKFWIELIRSDARSFAELQDQEAREIAVRDAIRNGYNVSPGGAIGTPTSVKVGSLQFPSRGAAAEYFGITAAAFNLRISRLGWTPEQAAEIEPRGKYSRQKVIVAGKPYSSLKQAAAAHGLDYRLVWSRVHTRKWSIEAALGIVSPPNRNKP